MEFYIIAGISYGVYQAFQFPTGWNSTELISITRIRIYSFNSQRDGILQFRKKARRGFIFVSIPNGMEFYRIRKKRSTSMRSFNSQRDGILPLSFLMRSVSLVFQFPTGWNSTQMLAVFTLPFWRFNSQRDGILQRKEQLKQEGYL